MLTYLERLVAVFGLEHEIAVAAQDTGAEDPHHLLVLNEQQRFRMACILYEYSRSLFAPILVHAGLNFGTVFFLMDGADAAENIPAALLWVGFFVMTTHLFIFGKGLYRR